MTDTDVKTRFQLPAVVSFFLCSSASLLCFYFYLPSAGVHPCGPFPTIHLGWIIPEDESLTFQRSDFYVPGNAAGSL